MAYPFYNTINLTKIQPQRRNHGTVLCLVHMDIFIYLSVLKTTLRIAASPTNETFFGTIPMVRGQGGRFECVGSERTINEAVLGKR